MKRLMMFSALLLAASPMPRGERVTKTLTPFWVADYSSLALHGAGAPINWAAFTDVSFGTAGRRVVPSGYPVMLTNGKIVPADGSANTETLLLMSSANEGVGSESISGYGLVTGGNVYEAQLPTATGTPRQLPAAVRARISARIRLQ